VRFRRGEPGPPDAGAAVKGRRGVYFEQAPGDLQLVDTLVYDRYALRPGMRLDGPAIVEERESTTVVPAGVRAVLDPYLNLVLDAV
jgi:N-methylhydantoinase A/oxoprolinase/acetone carboxylase beta subunit